MQYTPRSFIPKKGCIMNNASAEVASAVDYADSIRLFTVAPFSSNAPHGAPGPTEQQELQSVELSWTPASPRVVGAQGRFTTFSAVCWLYGKQLHNELGVPIGLVSSAVGGTAIGAWAPLASTESCNATGRATNGGDLANTMIYPFSVGPMGFRTVTWYQVRTNHNIGSSLACWQTLVNTRYGGICSAGIVSVRRVRRTRSQMLRVAIRDYTTTVFFRQ